MALFMKQDFKPSILTRKWFATKFRANKLLYSREHIITILESGLLFREDSIEVEQEAPSEEDVSRWIGGSWLTNGEKTFSLVLISGALGVAAPKNLKKESLLTLTAIATLPIVIRLVHRANARGGVLQLLLNNMRDYLAVSRRTMACLKEFSALHKELSSMTQIVHSTKSLLIKQQSDLSVLMSRASSSLLGNAPWIRSDVAWDFIEKFDSEDLMKIHHTFLVVQSTLLKHIALAHYIPKTTRHLYTNPNERIHWLHTTLITLLNKEFDENLQSLNRMYRLLKNYGNVDTIVKKPGNVLKDAWLYTEVHSGVAKGNLEISIALNKCNKLDVFLDNCAINKLDLDLQVLDEDLEDLIEKLTKSLNTIQASQMRLKKLKSKFVGDVVIVNNVTKMADEKTENTIKEIEPEEIKDEVYFFVKTEDNDQLDSVEADVTTYPGVKEKENTKTVLNELKRKLVRREDLMRERERQALIKTMPELLTHPEFPRQMEQDCDDKKGFLSKVRKEIKRRKNFVQYKIQTLKRKSIFDKKINFKTGKYDLERDIKTPNYQAIKNLKYDKILLSVEPEKRNLTITQWLKKEPNNNSQLKNEELKFENEEHKLKNEEHKLKNDNSDEEKLLNESIDETDSLSNGDHVSSHKTKSSLIDNDHNSSLIDNNDTDTDLSDFEVHKPLDDIRKNRCKRYKNYPSYKAKINGNKDLEPMVYTLGTGLAMASVLHTNNSRNMLEEVFVGDGEVSSDSGNDDS